ncbi:hypothetical protein [Anaerococcus cruorum]|uniref:Uncharacterized protein n=1 Tax=Anaerococcus cruorum TaxID=3115617 RepID=A0ABW9MU21_9FIRM
MTRHTPSNQFNKDIDKVFNHYSKYGDEYKKIAKNTKDMLKKVYNIGPDEWNTLHQHKKDKFIYVDLANKFLDSNCDYFTESEKKNIKNKIRPIIEDKFYQLEDLDKPNQMEDLKFMRYSDLISKASQRQVDKYYDEFVEVFKYFLPYDTPPSKAQFKKSNLRVYDFIQMAREESYKPLAYNEKFGVEKYYSDLDFNARLIFEYILEDKFKIKINYKLLAEALAFTEGYRSYYEIDEDYVDSYPDEPNKKEFDNEDDYNEELEFYNDTLKYLEYKKMLISRKAFIIDYSGQ